MDSSRKMHVTQDQASKRNHSGTISILETIKSRKVYSALEYLARECRNIDMSITQPEKSHIASQFERNKSATGQHISTQSCAANHLHTVNNGSTVLTEVKNKSKSIIKNKEQKKCNETNKIDILIKESIKKNKEKHELEQYQKIEAEEKQRQTKEMLHANNKMIREMNAMSFSRAKNNIQELIGGKQSWNAGTKKAYDQSKKLAAVTLLSSQKPVLTETQRRATLGLNFLDLKSKIFGSGIRKGEDKPRNIEVKKEKLEDKEKRGIIKNYMASKKEKIVLEKKILERESKLKKGKIGENMNRLKENVQKIFAVSQKNKNSTEKLTKYFMKSTVNKKKRVKSRTRKKQKKNEGFQLLTQINNYITGKSFDNETYIMEEIKENLLAEIKTNKDENKECIDEVNKDYLHKKMLDLAERYQRITQITPEKINSFQNESIVLSLKAVIIQKTFRGYLARKKCKEMMEKRPKSITKPSFKTETEPKPTEKEKEKEKKVEVKKESAPAIKESNITSPNKMEEPNVTSSMELRNFGKMLQGLESKSQNEKVVHLSRINTIEDGKEDNSAIEQDPQHIKHIPSKSSKGSSIGIQAAEDADTQAKPKEEKGNAILEQIEPKAMVTVETQTEIDKAKEQIILPEENKEEKKAMNKSSSLTEMRLLLGSEKLVKEALMQQIQTPQSNKSIKQILKDFNNGENSEKHNESVEMLIEQEHQQPESLFNRHSFQEFSVKKLKEMMKEDELSKLLSMREKVMKYKESTEKRYIQKMYKAKKFSPRTYQRKRKQLEKWITKEKEEIQKSKRGLVETWKQTAQIIEDVHKNAVQIKQTLGSHTLSHNSLSNSTFSLILDSSRPATDQGVDEDIKIRISKQFDPLEQQKALSRDKSLENLSDLLHSGDIPGSPLSTESKKIQSSEKKEPISRENFKDLYESDDDSDIQGQDNLNKPLQIRPNAAAILIQENESPGYVDDKEKQSISGIEIESPPRESVLEPQVTDKAIEKLSEIKEEKQVSAPPLPTPEEKNILPKEKELLGEEIVNTLYNQIVQELSSNLFPQRPYLAIEPMPAKPISASSSTGSQMSNPDQNEETPQLKWLLNLALSRKRGIPSEMDDIGEYLDRIFAQVLINQKAEFIFEVNQPIKIEILARLQGEDSENRIPMQLPHETHPIVPIETYLELEKVHKSTQGFLELNITQKKTLEECEHIHNKAVFDAVNEALNLIRPYGLNGEPMPWSSQQRILFKSIADPQMIIKNIKNMVT